MGCTTCLRAHTEGVADADAAETLAGVVRLLRRAAELVWAAVDAEGVASPRQVLGWGIYLAGDEAGNLLPDAISVDGPVPVGMNRPVSSAPPSSCCGAPRAREPAPGFDALRARVAHLVWEANTSVDD